MTHKWVPEEVLTLNADDYPGGVALWGAVPPVYDTTRLPLDRGIHVHARSSSKSNKDIDKTYRAVKLLSRRTAGQEFVISEIDAIYYMVSTIFGFEVKQVKCPLCGFSHLDKDWFSIHPHRRHLCAGCGRHFRDTQSAIGNPVRHTQDSFGFRGSKPKATKKRLSIRQSDYPGGIQIWGSNSAIFWSAPNAEKMGIHVHAYKRDDDEKPTEDETFSEVTIDGIGLDPAMIRILMAQSALPHLAGRVVHLHCADCRKPEFSVGDAAYTPKAECKCRNCGGRLLGYGRLRNVIGNPAIAALQVLAAKATRTPQTHALGLLPETI